MKCLNLWNILQMRETTEQSMCMQFATISVGDLISNKSVIKYKNINSHVIRLNQYVGGNSH